MAACNDYTESQSAALCGKHALNTLFGGPKTIIGDGDITNMKNEKVDTVNLSAICKLKRDDFSSKRKNTSVTVHDQYKHIINMDDANFTGIIATLNASNDNDKAYAKKLKEIRARKNKPATNAPFFDCSDNNQYFSEDVLTLAIELLGYTWKQLTLFSDAEIAKFYEGLTKDLNDPRCIGAIVCKGGKNNGIRYGGWHWTTLKKGCTTPKKDAYLYFDPIGKQFQEIQKNDLQTNLEQKIPIGYISVFQQGGAGPDMTPAGAAQKTTGAIPVRLGSVAPAKPASSSIPTPSEFTTVTLGTKSYTLPTDKVYVQHRADLFTAYASKENTLTHQQVLNGLQPDERVILHDTGFDDPSFLKRYAADMPKFFEALPKCTTDTAVMLHKECDASYFLIFALLHQKAQEHATKAATTGKPLTDLELLQKQAVLSGIATTSSDQKLRNLVANLVRIRTPGQTKPVALLNDLLARKKAAEKEILEYFTLYF